MSSDELQSSNQTTATPNEHVIFTDLDGVEGVLVDLNTKKYYQLNETAALVWRGLEKRLPLDKIAGQIAEAYDVSPDRARSSVENLIHTLQARKLVGSR